MNTEKEYLKLEKNCIYKYKGIDDNLNHYIYVTRINKKKYTFPVRVIELYPNTNDLNGWLPVVGKTEMELIAKNIKGYKAHEAFREWQEKNPEYFV